MPLKTYRHKEPTLAEGAHVFEGAMVIGDVSLARNVGVWFNATLRGDMDRIEIGENTNIQDNAVIHTDEGEPTTIGRDVTVGHSAIIHAATVEDGALIGMGSTILNGARIGEGALVAAGAVVPPNTQIPPGSLAVGNPARVRKELSEADRKQIQDNAEHYVELLKTYQE